MPTQTFFNLSESKKQRLLDAAIQEFTEHSVREASISNIIKDAEIPRGSFYQYFEDLDDLFFYLIDLFKEKFELMRQDAFQETRGDFRTGITTYAGYYIDYVMDSEHTPFLKGIYLNMNSRIKKSFNDSLVKAFEGHIQAKTDHLLLNGPQKLKIESEEELRELLKFIMSFLNQTISEGFSSEWTTQETKAVFNKRFHWILDGVVDSTKK